MTTKTRDRESAEEKAVRCLAHGIAHAHAAFGRQRLTTILGTIVIDFAASADTDASSGTPAKSDADVTFE
jgi:hypothetical protein